jgi:hypothetical protein
MGCQQVVIKVSRFRYRCLLASVPLARTIGMLMPCMKSRGFLQDRKRSDSMDPACDAAQLHGLLRRAIGLMRGLDICLTDESFKFSVISVIPVLKITEQCAIFPVYLMCSLAGFGLVMKHVGQCLPWLQCYYREVFAACFQIHCKGEFSGCSFPYMHCTHRGYRVHVQG